MVKQELWTQPDPKRLGIVHLGHLTLRGALSGHRSVQLPVAPGRRLLLRIAEADAPVDVPALETIVVDSRKVKRSPGMPSYRVWHIDPSRLHLLRRVHAFTPLHYQWTQVDYAIHEHEAALNRKHEAARAQERDAERWRGAQVPTWRKLLDQYEHTRRQLLRELMESDDPEWAPGDEAERVERADEGRQW